MLLRIVPAVGHRRALLRGLVATVTPLALAGCEETLSTVHPAGPAADAIALLWWVMLVGAAAIFALVIVLLVMAFRRAEGHPGAEADERHERIWIRNMGLGFTMAVLAALTVWGIHIGERLLPRPGPDVVSVGATGAQWTWHFTYADAPGRQTEGILHIPAGRPVDVGIESADVIHSFWVPRLAGKLDAVPGHTNVLRIQADAPGDYAGLSAEYSGPGYTGHRFTVRAHDEAGWNAFLRGES